jgi:hypothetical protein
VGRRSRLAAPAAFLVLVILRQLILLPAVILLTRAA